MDFNLKEEQLALQVMVKKFTEREIEPIARKHRPRSPVAGQPDC